MSTVMVTLTRFPASFQPRLSPCVSAVDREVRGSDPREVERNAHGFLEFVEGGVVVDTGDPLGQVEPGRTEHRRGEVQEHGYDRVVVQDDLPAGGEQQPSRPKGGFADGPLADRDRSASERVDQPMCHWIGFGQAQRVKYHRKPGSRSPSFHPTISVRRATAVSAVRRPMDRSLGGVELTTFEVRPRGRS
ncbi:hypothetical protein [Occultella gossypii]|uniref:Uncharacterized protein n=1 Tax=Occultella gossypii TaxID=2800820 RepID=A0ABS7S882_9MICO|nr:hypothetical protein [Occultella gossypii]MBZ2196563.1 hypothetical protein [Occultella gossypii]